MKRRVLVREIRIVGRVVRQHQQRSLGGFVVAVRRSQARLEELRPARVPADHMVDLRLRTS